MGEHNTSGSSKWDDGRDFYGCSSMPESIQNLLRDRPPRAPFEGFGGLRMRTYRAQLTGVDREPARIFDTWMDHFPATWPAGNHFIPCAPGLEPGVTAAILLSMPGGMRVVTGARVVHRGATSLTLQTLLGHMFAGLITFSVSQQESDPILQVQALVSPGDPLYELVFRLGIGQRGEDEFWHAALFNAASLFNVPVVVQQENRTISTNLQWRYFRNIWYNAGIRSTLRYFGRSFQNILNRQHPEPA